MSVYPASEISNESREKITKNLQTKPLIPLDTDNLPEVILWTPQVTNIIKDPSISTKEKINVLQRLQENIPFSKINNFLKNNSIELLEKTEVAKKLQENIPFSEINNFLTDENIHRYIRIEVAKKLQKNTPFFEINNFLIDKNIPWGIRITLLTSDLNYVSVLKDIQQSAAFDEIISYQGTSLSQVLEKATQDIFSQLGIDKIYDDKTRATNTTIVNTRQIPHQTEIFIERSLTLYLRYRHTVNHGLTLDFLTRIAQQYIEKNHSALWSNIRLVPYSSETIPYETANLKKCTVYNVHDTAFEDALYKESDAVSFSHSRDTGRKRHNGNALASNNSIGDLSSCQKLDFEFENHYAGNAPLNLHTASLLEIAQSFINSLQIFEKSLYSS